MSSWCVFVSIKWLEILSQKEKYHFQISLVVTHQLQQFHLCFHLRISEKEDSFQMGKYSIPYLDPMGMNISQIIFANISYLSNIASINPIRGKSHTFRTGIPQKKQVCFGFLWFLWWNISQQWPYSAAFLSKEKTYPIVVCHTSVDDCNRNFDHHWVMQLFALSGHKWHRSVSSLICCLHLIYSFFANASLSKLNNFGGFSSNHIPETKQIPHGFQHYLSYQKKHLPTPIPSIYPIYWPIYLSM